MNNISICVTIKNRSEIKYTKILPDEAQLIQQHDSVINLIPNCPVKKNVESVKGTTYMLKTFIESLKIGFGHYDKVQLVVYDWASVDVDVLSDIKKYLKDDDFQPLISFHENTNTEEKFSRGFGLNTCAEHAIHPILHFTDIDIEYQRPIKIPLKDDGSCAYFPIVYKEVSPSALYLYAEIAGYGISFTDKKTWQDSGKFPDYRSWGNEDNIFYEQVSKIKNIDRKIDIGIVHKWHSNLLRGT